MFWRNKSEMYGRVIVFPKKEVTMFRNRHLIKTHETDFTNCYVSAIPGDSHFNSKGDLSAINYGPTYREYLVENIVMEGECLR